MAAGDQGISQLTGVIDFGISLGDDVIAFFNRRQEFDLICDFVVADLTVWGFHKTVGIGARIQGQRVDQTDVRTFRRFNRADTTIVRRMHVANFKAGTLTRQTARTQCGNTTLVRDLGQRVGLVHKLRQLAGTEELLDRGTDRLGIDQVVRHQVIAFSLIQTLLDCALDAHQTGTELVLGQLTNGTHATIAQVVNIVDFTATIAQLNQNLDGFNDVARAERHLLANFGIQADGL